MLRKSNQPITGTILVADDQSSNRELLEELLTTQGFKVIGVADGAAALEELTRVQADLVLLDVMMPKRSGWEVCQALKGVAHLAFVAVTIVGAANAANAVSQGPLADVSIDASAR